MDATSLQTLSARYALAFELTAVAQVVVEPGPTPMGWQVVDCNQAACRFLQRDRADILGADVSLAGHADDLVRETRLFVSVLKGERDSYRIEKRFFRPDGEVVWALVEASAQRDESGRVLRWVLQAFDITERRELERSLAAHLLERDLVALVAARLVDVRPAELSVAVSRALEDLGGALGADVANAFALQADGSRLALVGTWHGPGFPDLGHGDGWLPAAEFASVRAFGAGLGVVVVDAVDELPEDWVMERGILTKLGTSRHAVVPLRDGQRLLGVVFLGTTRSSWNWPGDVGETLRAIGEVMGRSLARVENDRRLGFSEERYRSLIEALPTPVLRVDEELRVTFANAAAAQVAGRPAKELEGRRLDELWWGERNAQRAIEPVRRVLAGGDALDTEYRLHLSDRDEWFQCRAVAERDGTGRVASVLVAATPITARKRAEQALEHRALHDPLTGLANRALFHERLELALTRARRRGERPAVLFIDVDRLKAINDELGHEGGDVILTAVAHRLATAVRLGDLAARLGGDEFAVLCEGVAEPSEAEAVANRVAAAVSAPLEVAGAPRRVTVSIGVVLATGSCSAEDVLRDADTAMYWAKHGGRNRVDVFDEAARSSFEARRALEGDLRHALERGQLVVYYQPVHDLTDGHVVGVEALVRWAHPRRGLLVPAEFLWLAEETGLVVPLGAQVVTDACRVAARLWPGEDGPTVWVNLSARQLVYPGLAKDLVAAADEAGLPPSRLGVEIGERALSADPGASRRILGDLRNKGLCTGIDDFGSGLSSLALLRELPLDVVKLDQELTAGLSTRGADSAMVRSVTPLAHELGLAVVAEAVETEEHRQLLRSMEVDRAQGHLWDRPVGPERLGEVMVRG